MILDPLLEKKLDIASRTEILIIGAGASVMLVDEHPVPFATMSESVPQLWGGLAETEDMPIANRPSTPLAGHIAQRVAQLFPKAAPAKVIRSWAGIIENTPDGRPVLDRPGRGRISPLQPCPASASAFPRQPGAP